MICNPVCNQVPATPVQQYSPGASQNNIANIMHISSLKQHILYTNRGSNPVQTQFHRSASPMFSLKTSVVQPNVRLPSSTVSRRTVCFGLKENVAQLPPIDDIVRVRIPEAEWTIENVQGKKASVAIFSYLASTYGKLNKEAALKALELYDEVVADAKARPGAHPNIDLCFKVLEQNLALDIDVDKA